MKGCIACPSYFIILTVRTRDVRNHDRLQPVWGSLRLAQLSELGFNEFILTVECLFPIPPNLLL